MKMPWQGKNGLAKATAILATVFTLSLGLCGANFVAFTRFGQFEGPPNWRSTLLWYTAYAELLLIIGSLFGLIIVFLLYVVRPTRRGKD